ncbi:dicarboxylate/amino acid:cation symporter [Parvularcula sp. LCG005]|uniref:dicarboxylate/amino acid:cation symporter n=1 Tax=Parvularcula sp. LCG005 TaxID=3078805 RepID=UPI002942D072|nr:dicarboxylate/amino acid:cation symporter [Parvularcula sp. LCG005]WOI53295.1 dicarboxylate/amino acid:cation symporter [Parvularcula sp. LCG005]
MNGLSDFGRVFVEQPTAPLFWIITLAVFAVLFFLGRVLRLPLWLRVIIALIAGGIVGYIFGDTAASIKPLGDAFIKLIRMLIVPLVFTTIVGGVISMGDPKRLGGLGLKTIGLYLCTTVFAVVIGIISGIVFQPGNGVDYQSADSGAAQAQIMERLGAAAEAERSAVQQLLDVIPSNPVESLATGDILPIIFFAILFGIAIIASGQGEEAIGKTMESAAEAILKLTNFVMALAPYGVFALMAWVLGTQGLAILENLAKLTLALYVACVVQMVFVYGGIIRVLLGLPFFRFLGGIADAMGTAYSTASSSATLPVTISNVNHNLGVDRSIAGSTLPIGATINMDGTSIYLGLVALFAAQALGMDLTLGDYVAIAVTATATSVGVAGIPSASLFLAVAVLATFGVTTEQAVLIIALVFPFDRLLDMMRTMTNVTGDAAVATAVAKWEGGLNEEIFRQKAKE